MNRTPRFALLVLVAFLGGPCCFAQEGDAASTQQADNGSLQIRHETPASNLIAKYTAPEIIIPEPAAVVRTTTPIESLPEQPKPHKRLWMGLTIMGQLAAGADVGSTITMLKAGGWEEDPLARPFTNLPKPGYALTSAALAGAVSILGARMQQSRRFHRVWWVPQALQIIGNSAAATHNSLILAHSR